MSATVFNTSDISSALTLYRDTAPDLIIPCGSLDCKMEQMAIYSLKGNGDSSSM